MIGGFASQVMHLLIREGVFDSGLAFRPMVMPDRFLDHDTPAAQVQRAGLDSAHIVTTVQDALGSTG